MSDPLTISFTKEHRGVLGQNEDGTPNGEDYIEERWVTPWKRVDELTEDDPALRMRALLREVESE